MSKMMHARPHVFMKPLCLQAAVTTQVAAQGCADRRVMHIPGRRVHILARADATYPFFNNSTPLTSNPVSEWKTSSSWTEATPNGRLLHR
jgi:hypothetical protein